MCTTETNTDMGVAAALAALEDSGVKPEELDLIIGATISADTISPGAGGHGAEPHRRRVPLL